MTAAGEGPRGIGSGLPPPQLQEPLARPDGSHDSGLLSSLPVQQSTPPTISYFRRVAKDLETGLRRIISSAFPVPSGPGAEPPQPADYSDGELIQAVSGAKIRVERYQDSVVVAGNRFDVAAFLSIVEGRTPRRPSSYWMLTPTVANIVQLMQTACSFLPKFALSNFIYEPTFNDITHEWEVVITDKSSKNAPPDIERAIGEFRATGARLVEENIDRMDPISALFQLLSEDDSRGAEHIESLLGQQGHSYDIGAYSDEENDIASLWLSVGLLVYPNGKPPIVVVRFEEYKSLNETNADPVKFNEATFYGRVFRKSFFWRGMNSNADVEGAEVFARHRHALASLFAYDVTHLYDASPSGSTEPPASSNGMATPSARGTPAPSGGGEAASAVSDTGPIGMASSRGVGVTRMSDSGEAPATYNPVLAPRMQPGMLGFATPHIGARTTLFGPVMAVRMPVINTAFRALSL